jgi:hypothetical protein
MDPIHPSTNSIPGTVLSPFRLLTANKNTFLPIAFVWALSGALYGALVALLTERFELLTFSIEIATLVFFLMTFYATAGCQHMIKHLTKLREVQGTINNIFFKLRIYLDSHDDQAQVFAIRDLILASLWAILGPLASLEAEALARVVALLPDDLPYK